MAKDRGELTGLEWEAEKAYIVATSPRNTSQSNVKDDDEFSFGYEVVEVIEKENVLSKHEIEYNSDVVLLTDDGEDSSVTIDNETESSMVTSKGITTALLPKDESDSEMISRHSSLTNTPTLLVVNQTPEHQDNKQQQQQPIPSSPATCSSKVPSGKPTVIAMDSAKKPIVQSDSQIVIIYGPSGYGKGVLVQKLVYRSPQQFSLAVSHTTRAQRLQEMYARDFYFISKTDMIKKIKDDAFMEYVQIDHVNPVQTNRDYSQQNTPRGNVMSLSSTTGELYGTTWESFQEVLLSNKPCVVLNISTKGAEQVQALGINATYLLVHPGKEPEDCGTIVPDYTISIDNKEEAFGLLEEYGLCIARKDTLPCSPKQLDKTEEEWERVPNIQLTDEKGCQKKKVSKKRLQLSDQPTSFGELLNHFQNISLTEQLTRIKPEIQSSKFFSFTGPPKINKHLRQERDMIFAIALCKFDDCNPLHTRSLSTIYRRLTGGGPRSACMRFGTHWEEIGFQGSDPIDDLRGVGMLGIVQLVWLLETPWVQLIASDVYQYSRQHGHEIPFSILILNITCLSLQALREGCLSRQCNRCDQVFAVINDFTAAILLSFFYTWQKQARGPMEIGMVLQEVGNFAKKHPRYWIKEMKKYLTQLEKKQSTIITSRTLDSEERNDVGLIQFTKLESTDPFTN